MRADENLPLIEPRRGKREEPLPGAAVLVFTSPDLDLLIHSFPEHSKPSRKIYLSDVFEVTCGGTSVAVAGPMLGAPQAVMVLEKLIALGVRSVVALGWCGSLREGVCIGDVILPSGAVSEEGTSGHYPPESRDAGPSERLCGVLRDALCARGLKLHEGRVWSTDGFFRETAGKVLGHQRSGVLGVDMETSALFTVADFRGIDLASVLIVSDELHTLKWKHGFRSAEFHRTRERIIAPVVRSVCLVEEPGDPGGIPGVR